MISFIIHLYGINDIVYSCQLAFPVSLFSFYSATLVPQIQSLNLSLFSESARLESDRQIVNLESKLAEETRQVTDLQLQVTQLQANVVQLQAQLQKQLQDHLQSNLRQYTAQTLHSPNSPQSPNSEVRLLYQTTSTDSVLLGKRSKLTLLLLIC